MFPRRERISRAAFPTALSGGRRLSSAHFSIVIPRAGRGYAVVVPKKVAKSSVVRHRIKRRSLAALEALPRPQSVILFPKAPVARLPLPALKDELAALLSKAGGTP